LLRRTQGLFKSSPRSDVSGALLIAVARRRTHLVVPRIHQNGSASPTAVQHSQSMRLSRTCNLSTRHGNGYTLLPSRSFSIAQVQAEYMR
jgi:hypothetical protein